MPETRSRRVLFGTWTSGDKCYPCEWNAETGWLSLDGEHVARVKSEERVQNIMLGWIDHVAQPNSIHWLTSRLDRYR